MEFLRESVAVGIAHGHYTGNPVVVLASVGNIAAVVLCVIAEAALVFFAIKHINSNTAQLEEYNNQLEAKTALLEKQKLFIAKLAHAASHDFREPVRSVSMFAQLLASKYGKDMPAEAKEMLKYIDDESKRMYNLTTSMVNISSLETEKYELNAVNLRDVVKDSVKELEPLITPAKGSVNYENLPVVKGNKALLQILFSNLISNSIHYRAHKEPEVSINCNEEKGGYLITVKDNGTGFNNKYKGEAFEMFKRLNNSQHRGAGMGLAICKKIAEIHNGEIRAESTENEGTTVTLRLNKI